VLDLLRTAERADPAVTDATEAVRADLYLEKWYEARVARDAGGETFYAALVRSHDRDGRHTATLVRTSPCTIASDPPGAEVYAYRYREQADVVAGGDHRLVPVPVHGASPDVPPGAHVFRVVAKAGDLLPGDIVLEVSGRAAGDTVLATAPARVYRAGRVEDVDLPAGLEVRETAAPLVPGACALLGTTPLATELPEGDYVLLLRRAGCEDQRYGFVARDGGAVEIALRLATAGSVPPGFVRVPTEHGAVLLMEREVTLAEYLLFLNDPGTIARLGSDGVAQHAPRGPAGVMIDRADGGTFLVPPEWRGDWPAFGLNWHDAVAYVAWRSARDGRRYELPDFAVWQAAFSGGTGRRYPYGDRFRAKWMKSCYARPHASPEPVLRFPIDESPYGVYDMGGSVREWLDGFYDEARGVRCVAGGSWALAKPEQFERWGTGFDPMVALSDAGIRLALREGAP
jgi:hypothetical protein